MAIPAATGLAEFDLVGVREDLSDVLSGMLLSDATFLSRIGISGVATNVKHEWLESSLNANSVTDDETGGLDAAGTNVDLAVTTGQGVRVRIGSLLKDTARGKTEVLQVTAISTDTLTVTRGYGDTSPEIHAEGSQWDIIAEPKQSGADVSDDTSTTRVRKDNYCQIFEKGVKINGDTQAVNKAGVPDELARQTMERMLELTVRLDKSVLEGEKLGPASDSALRTMGGLTWFLSQSGANYNATAEEISPDVINELYLSAYDDGGNPTVLLCNQKQLAKISNFDADKVRITVSEGLRGGAATRFLTDQGAELEIVKDRWFRNDSIALLDMSRISVMPLQGRAFGMKDIGVTGDSFKRQVLGDYTMEVRNATQAHALHTNLAF